MTDGLATDERLAAGAGATSIATLAGLLVLKIEAAPSYPDFIVGNITWQADGKLQDLLFAPIAAIAFALSFVLLLQLLARRRACDGQASAQELARQLVLWSLPAIGSLFALVLGASVDLAAIGLSAAGTLFLCATLGFNRGGPAGLSPALASAVGFAAILIGLLPLEVRLAAGRASGSDTWDSANVVVAVYLTAGLCLSAGAATLVWLPRFAAAALPYALLAGQLGLCLLVWALYPAALVQPDGTVSAYKTTIWLWVALASLFTVAGADVVDRFRQFRQPGASRVLLFSPIALFIGLAIAKFGNTEPLHLNTDDYHFGERLLGWWSYLHGAIPYVDFIPPHGLVDDDLAGVLASLFYDGSAASVADSHRLVLFGLSLVAFLAIWRTTGSIALGLAATLLMPPRAGWLFIAPVICIWLSPALQKRPVLWLGVWLITLPIIVLGIPGQGVVLLAASGLFGAHLAWRFATQAEERSLRPLELALAAAALLLLIPLWPMLMGAIRYVLENGPINQIAYGVPWEISWRAGEQKGFFFELIRMGWIGAIVIFVAVAARDAIRKPFDLPRIVPSLFALAFLLLMVPYTMGRIDPGEISRPGSTTALAIGFLIPILLARRLGERYVPLLAMSIVAIGAALSGQLPSLPMLAWASSPHVVTGHIDDGAALGFPNIGATEIDPGHLARLQTIKGVLDRSLPPGAPYLDLTSRNAQYFYLGRRVPMPVSAPYNMAALSQQKDAVARLKAKPPGLALLEASNIVHDGGGIALRTPLLYRFVLDTYAPEFRDGLIVGVPRAGRAAPTQLTADLSGKSDEQWDGGVNRREAAVQLANPYLARVIAADDTVLLADDDRRRVLRVDQAASAIWLDGAALTPQSLRYPDHKLRVELTDRLRHEYEAELYDVALGKADLAKIPVAWGLSEASLQTRMASVLSLGAPSGIDQMKQRGDMFAVTGSDPKIVFDTSRRELSGGRSDLLRFTFSCLGQHAEAQIQIFWWGDGEAGPFERQSLKFTAGNGVLIVPMYASARWALMRKIDGLRIDLANPTACDAIRVTDIGLFRRVFD